jgi:hypothetical protein
MGAQGALPLVYRTCCREARSRRRGARWHGALRARPPARTADPGGARAWVATPPRFWLQEDTSAAARRGLQARRAATDWHSAEFRPRRRPRRSAEATAKASLRHSRVLGKSCWRPAGKTSGERARPERPPWARALAPRARLRARVQTGRQDQDGLGQECRQPRARHRAGGRGQSSRCGHGWRESTGKGPR